jgi:hypothetical protein
MIRSTALLATLLLMSNSSIAQDVKLPFEKHVLDNGLQVVIHEDHSDPVVAVYVIYHVGSGREDPGAAASRTCSSTSCSRAAPTSATTSTSRSSARPAAR